MATDARDSRPATQTVSPNMHTYVLSHGVTAGRGPAGRVFVTHVRLSDIPCQRCVP